MLAVGAGLMPAGPVAATADSEYTVWAVVAPSRVRVPAATVQAALVEMPRLVRTGAQSQLLEAQIHRMAGSCARQGLCWMRAVSPALSVEGGSVHGLRTSALAKQIDGGKQVLSLDIKSGRVVISKNLDKKLEQPYNLQKKESSRPSNRGRCNWHFGTKIVPEYSAPALSEP